MDDVIGFGSNGVVVASRQSAGKALKYWLPHVMRGSIVGDSRSLSLFKGFFLGRNRFRVKVRGARLSIKFFGEAFPLDQVNSFARKANVIIADVCITQDLESPRCKLYSILHSCHPWPLKNGVLEMELAGPPVYLRLPLTYKEVNRLVAVLCEAAQSALLQGVAIVDLKPENICDAFNREGWIIVDVDDLPVVSDPHAYQSATYTVKNTVTAIRAMVASLVITAALLAGVITKGVALEKFFHMSKRMANWSELESICHPALIQVLHSSPDTVGWQLGSAAYEARLLASESSPLVDTEME